MDSRTAIRTFAVMGCMLFMTTQVAGGGQPTPAAPADDTGRHLVLIGRTRLAVSDALDGAIRRLADDRCQLVLTDFADREGRLLRMSLERSGQTSAAALAALYFVDGDDTPQCRTNENLGAFTEPGSRVVHVCGKRFVQFARKPVLGELLLIHEFLHTLGLAENPPTSAQITKVVLRRCG